MSYILKYVSFHFFKINPIDRNNNAYNLDKLKRSKKYPKFIKNK